MLRTALEAWISGDWQNRTQLRNGFFKHNDHIRSVVPKDRLLKFRSEDGWEPL